jgi:hypothetical protein
MSENIKRWRGLVALVADAVANGSGSIERVHLSTAQVPFTVLDHIPVIAAPAAVVEKIHRVSVQGVYASVRIVTRIVEKTIDVVLEVADDGR